MTFQLLISTMNQDDYEGFLKKMNIQTDCVVINQCNRESECEFTYNGHSILWIDSTQRGLSRSRNLAIKRASADICLLSDDDLIYYSDYKKKIIDAFTDIEKASVIGFKIEGIEKVFKNYSDTRAKCGYIKSMKMSSVEIAFKRQDITDKKIEFDELIGAGTQFLMGEENAFLFNCLKNGLNIYFEPQTIAKLHIGDSSWFTGYNSSYFIGRGASFAAMSTVMSYLLVLQFAVRKYRLYKKDKSFFSALLLMLKGISAYKKLNRK